MSEAVVATPAVEEVKMDVEATTSTAENKQTETSEHVEVPPLAEKAGESVVSAAKPDKEVTPDNEEVRQSAIRQVEFYFADSNLPFDKFMWTLHTANPEHWVPLATVASFKRMRDWQKYGTSWIANTLRASEELEVSEDGTQIRRRTEVKPPKDQFERSIYAKGFGTEEKAGIQKELEDFFQKYGRTNAVRMRRTEDKQFKGSVFVEFNDFKSVEAFLNADPKPSWNGEELLIMTKEDYCEMKIKEKGLSGKAARLRKQTYATGKGFNAFREMDEAKNREKKDKVKTSTVEEKAPELFIEFMGSKIRVQDGDEGNVNVDDVPVVKGASLKFEGAGASTSFDEVKTPLKERFPRTPFVKHTRGEASGLVGFEKPLSEDEIAYVKEHIKTLGGQEVTWSVPDEESERAFQLERAQASARRAVQFNQSRGSGRGRGGGRGGGGRGGGRGRGRGRGGRGGRGGSRLGGRSNDSKDGPSATAGEETGEKRKRAVEPDGGPNVGQRGQAVPLIQPAKKAKVEG